MLLLPPFCSGHRIEREHMSEARALEVVARALRDVLVLAQHHATGECRERRVEPPPPAPLPPAPQRSAPARAAPAPPARRPLPTGGPGPVGGRLPPVGGGGARIPRPA